MSPQVVSVRQNLVPLVGDGRVNPDCATGGQREWGDTIGQAAYIDRSGFGVTADGARGLRRRTRAVGLHAGPVLADAGVVRGMELDINPGWVSGAYFTTASAARPAGSPRSTRRSRCPRPLPQPVEPRLVLLVHALNRRRSRHRWWHCGTLPARRDRLLEDVDRSRGSGRYSRRGSLIVVFATRGRMWRVS